MITAHSVQQQAKRLRKVSNHFRSFLMSCRLGLGAACAAQCRSVALLLPFLCFSMAAAATIVIIRSIVIQTVVHEGGDVCGVEMRVIVIERVGR